MSCNALNLQFILLFYIAMLHIEMYDVFISVYNAAQEFQFYTPVYYNYNKVWYRAEGQSSIMFQVQACSDAYVGLFDQYMIEMAYEIAIGETSNTMSSIRRTILLDTKNQVNFLHFMNLD